MNKEQLQERIKGLQMQMEQLKANFNKVEGHLEECTHWLMALIKFEAEEAKKAKELEDGGKEVDPESNQEAGGAA